MSKIPDNWEELDVSQVASRGHVLVERFQVLTKRFQFPALIVGGIAGYQIAISLAVPFEPSLASYALINPASISVDARPPAVLAADAIDPIQTAAKTPVNSAPSVSYANWQDRYPPTGKTLSLADLSRLSEALNADMKSEAMNFKSWRHVAGLAVPPKITRKEKAIAKYADRLKTGIVTIMDGQPVVPVVSHVEGQWSVLLFKAGSCRVMLGPMPEGCADFRSAGSEVSPEAQTVFDMIAPKG